ncbi:MAG: DUF4011 domain-containing protein, partial [Acidobacteria bacterium]|nr:DUF4011 domain-containing protein [Acidobacteriota bacterium]
GLNGEEKREVVVGTAPPTRIGAEEYARQLGINTSYELERGDLTGVTVERGRAGNELQVLHYVDDLGRIADSLIELNLEVEREMGLTTLYLIIGFLDWYESPAAEARRQAPLLLAPVVLSKGRMENHEDETLCTLRWSGEKVIVNPALRLMTGQRFGVSLPELGEGESVESYLGRLSTLILAQPRWQVRHRLTLTNLTFHNLLIWEDLDSHKWPGERLADHPLLRDLFNGIPVEAVTGDPAAIEELDELGKLPPFIYEGDSTQQLAILEALQGGGKVIESPPGTCRSEMIANLIGAALWQGRSVLFVARGVRALADVRRRMSEAGLGDFCLHLGSQANSRERQRVDNGISRASELAVDLRNRLTRRGSYNLPATLPQKQAIRREYRQRLIEYESMIGTHYAACGRTIAQTIGIREGLFNSLSQAIGSGETLSLIDGLRMERVESFTLSQVEALEENAEICEQSLTQLTSESALTAHPWRGLRRESLDPEEINILLDLLQATVDVTDQITETLRLFAEGGGPVPAAYDRSLGRLIEMERLLPAPDPEVRRELLPKLAAPETRVNLRTLGALLSERQGLEEGLSRIFHHLPEPDPENLDRLRDACRRISELGLDEATIGELRQKAVWMTAVSDYIARSATIFDQITNWLQCELSYDLASVQTLVRALVLLNESPLGVLSSRVRGLERDGIGPVLTRARQEAEQVRRLGLSLANRVDRQLSPPIEDLARYAIAAANAGPFSFVSRDFREARREWLGMVKQDEVRTARQMARDLRDLLRYRNQMQEFTDRSEYIRVLGPIFKGLDTPFTEYDQLIKWYDRIKLILGQSSEPARRVARSLFAAPVDNLKALVHFKNVEAREHVEDFISFFGNFGGLGPDIPGAVVWSETESLHSLALGLRELAEVCQSVGATFADLQVETDHPIRVIGKSLDGLSRLSELRESIRSGSDLARSIGLTHLRALDDLTGVEPAINFVERLEASGLPTDYRVWLCDVDIDRRLSLMRETIGCLKGLYHRYQEVRERFNAVSGIDEAEWYGIDTSSVELSLPAVGERARRALVAQDELAVWLIARRAWQTMTRQGLAGLVDLFLEGRIPAGSLVDAVRFVYHNSVLAGAFRQFPRLLESNRMVLDETCRRLAVVEEEVVGLNRQLIAARLDDQHLPPGNRLGPVNGFTQLGLISHLASNQNMRIGIREVLSRGAGALVALKPCFMMSPWAVASYLPPESIRFDLVILDNASELRPEEVIGSIARGGQLVVVGDHLQLPPGDLPDLLPEAEPAARGLSGVNGADRPQVEAPGVPDRRESILDLASLRYQPVRQLRWQSAQKPEKLISFSNSEFYHDRLIVPPSSMVEADKGGVSLSYVEDGIRTGDVNRPEARRVVEAAISHLLNHPHESLGIVGFGRRQQELIQELLEQAIEDNPIASKARQLWRDRGEEPVVTSLETLSADERDAILISGAIGRDPEGHLRPDLRGPLSSHDHGHRWLNVALTRARRRLVCFTSIRSNEIQSGPGTAWGLQAWRNFLAFLETGQHSRASSDMFQGAAARITPFEQAVAESLRGRGLRVVPRVGSHDGAVELAIADPLEPDNFLLGIEVMTEAGRAGGTISDRYRYRPSILKARGWRLHRIWLTEWARFREQEIERIIRMVGSLPAV